MTETTPILTDEDSNDRLLTPREFRIRALRVSEAEQKRLMELPFEEFRSESLRILNERNEEKVTATEQMETNENNRRGTLLTPEYLATNPKEYFLLLTWRDWNPNDSRTDEQILEAQAKARERLAPIYATSPLYRERAEKDPNYWKTFYIAPCHFKE
jgi:hypothetical protein